MIIKAILPDPQSEEKFKTNRQRPRAGEIVIQIEGIQRIILIGNIQETDPDLRGAMQEAIAHVGVGLPKTGITQFRGIAQIALGSPDRLQLAEKAAGQVII